MKYHNKAQKRFCILKGILFYNS